MRHNDASTTQASATSSASASAHRSSHHPRHHSKKKKGSDPFLDLADADIKLSDLPSPSSAPRPGSEDSHSDSLFADLVLTPLIMISFVLSLGLVERQQRRWRLSQHSAGTESFWSRFTSWLDPEPYQDPRDATWKHSSDGPAQNTSETTFHGWSARKKRRQVAKMEINDAFDMSGRVLFALLAWSILGILGLTYATRRMYGWLSTA